MFYKTRCKWISSSFNFFFLFASQWLTKDHFKSTLLSSNSFYGSLWSSSIGSTALSNHYIHRQHQTYCPTLYNLSFLSYVFLKLIFSTLNDYNWWISTSFSMFNLKWAHLSNGLLWMTHLNMVMCLVKTYIRYSIRYSVFKISSLEQINKLSVEN